MRFRALAWVLFLGSTLGAAAAFAYDCSGLPEWKRQHYYLLGDRVQDSGSAYENTVDGSKRDRPDAGDPWLLLGACDDPGGGGGGGGGGNDPQPLSIYGVWHCGDSYCDWSHVRDTSPGGEFDLANRWIVDRDAGGDHRPSVNLVVLAFLEPRELLAGTTSGAFVGGIPAGMTPAVVDYFASRGIRVLLSMGGVTYTDSWNEALVSDPGGLAAKAVAAVEALGADGLEIDWENGRPDDAQLAGIETFIDTFNSLSGAVLTLDLAVGDRYLQELSRRAAADWLPNGEIDWVNAMVPRGEPSTSQWQEHVDGKSNYDPPILPKAPARVAVSLWLTDSRSPNPNCVDFASSSQLEKAGYVQSVAPNGAGLTSGFVGYMFWAAECPATRNVCTTPPNGCEGGMGAGATHFDIPLPLDFSALRGPASGSARSPRRRTAEMAPGRLANRRVTVRPPAERGFTDAAMLRAGYGFAFSDRHRRSRAGGRGLRGIRRHRRAQCRLVVRGARHVDAKPGNGHAESETQWRIGSRKRLQQPRDGGRAHGSVGAQDRRPGAARPVVGQSDRLADRVPGRSGCPLSGLDSLRIRHELARHRS